MLSWVWIVIFHASAFPTVAIFEGLISWGVVDPITAVTFVPPFTWDEVWQVIVGDDTVIEKQVAPVNDTLVFAKPLNANPVADGDAVLFAVPGKVIIILPEAGIVLTVVNLIVCFAVTATVIASPR